MSNEGNYIAPEIKVLNCYWDGAMKGILHLGLGTVYVVTIITFYIKALMVY